MPIHFDQGNWERIAADFSAWWAHDLDRPLIQVTGKEPDPHVEYPTVHKFTSNFPETMSADEIIHAVTLDLEAMRYYGDAFPRWWVNYGPGIAAGFLGAEVHSVPETVWFSPKENQPASQLHLTYDPTNRWWLRAKALTAAAVEAWGGLVQVSHTDLGGNLDILASFRTTEGLLYDLHDCPEEIDRLVGEITALWRRYYEELDAIIRPTCPGTTPWAPIWSSGTCYMLQSDFSYMISPAMFERFVLPDLVACCDYLDHGFYHLDGRGEIPHLDRLLGIERLRGIQWVPGDGAPPPPEWLGLLKRIIDGGKLCQLFVTAEGARTIVRHLGGKGFLLSVQDTMTADEAQAYLALLAREDANA